MEERLRKFSYLLDAGSFTKAASDLHISQPALSTAIHKLERELGTQLVQRDRHSLKLTKTGRLAYDSAKDLGVVTDNLRIRIAELNNEKPHINLGMTDSVAVALFGSSESVNELEQQTDLSITVNNSRYLADAVERNEIDIAFITDKPKNRGAVFISEPAASEPFVVVCNPNILPEINQALVHGELPNFISYDKQSATRRIVDMKLKSCGIKPIHTYYSTSPSVALQLVLLEKGVAALPYLIAKDYLSTNTLVLVGRSKHIIIERPISVIRRRNKYLSAQLSNTKGRVHDIFDNYRDEMEKIYMTAS
jgi:DNA-binding transcriptional LysR family regulator